MRFLHLLPARRLLALTLLALAPLASASAQTGRVALQSHKSFDQTVNALKAGVSHGGMMIMATVDQGNMLSMTGLPLKATLFLVGNPTVGKMLFQQSHAVGLYVPLRIFVYQARNGKTYVSFDTPSTLLGQFHNDAITKTSRMLDQKLQMLAQMAAQ